MLGALPRECVRRIEPGRAVGGRRRAAGRSAPGATPSDLHAVSGGNPFFVTEALAAPAGAGVPGERARRGRAARRRARPARARGRRAAPRSCPGATELWLRRRRVGAGPTRSTSASSPACCSCAARRSRSATTSRAARSRTGISPLRRRELDRLVLARARGGAATPTPRGSSTTRGARATRTRSAGSPPRRRAPPAPRGGHRQALEHWEAALEAGERRRRRRRSRASRSRPTCAGAWSARSRRAARCSRSTRRRATRCAPATTLRWLVAPAVVGRARARRRPQAGDRAIARARGVPGQPRAGDGAQRPLAARDALRARTRRRSSSARAPIALARRLGDRETVAHALTNVGTAHRSAARTSERGRALLEEAFVLAVGGGHDDHAARALVNLATGTLMRRRDDPRVETDIERALRFARERELDGYVQYLLGMRANLRLLRGDWDAAEARRPRVARARRAARRQPVPGADRARPAAGPPRRSGGAARRSTRPGERAVATQRAAAARAGRGGAGRARVARRRPRRRRRDRARRPTSWPPRCGDAWARGELASLAVARRASPCRRRPDDPDAVRARDRRRLARRGGRLGRARLPVRARRGARGRRRRGRRGSRRSRASTRSAPRARPRTCAGACGPTA